MPILGIEAWSTPEVLRKIQSNGPFRARRYLGAGGVRPSRPSRARPLRDAGEPGRAAMRGLRAAQIPNCRRW